MNGEARNDGGGLVCREKIGGFQNEGLGGCDYPEYQLTAGDCLVERLDDEFVLTPVGMRCAGT